MEASPLHKSKGNATKIECPGCSTCVERTCATLQHSPRLGCTAVTSIGKSVNGLCRYDSALSLRSRSAQICTPLGTSGQCTSQRTSQQIRRDLPQPTAPNIQGDAACKSTHITPTPTEISATRNHMCREGMSFPSTLNIDVVARCESGRIRE